MSKDNKDNIGSKHNNGNKHNIGRKDNKGNMDNSGSITSARTTPRTKVKVKAMAPMGYHGEISSLPVPPMAHLHGTASIAGPDSKQVRHAASVVDLIIVNSPTGIPTLAKLLYNILPLVKVGTSRQSSRLVHSKDISVLVKVFSMDIKVTAILNKEAHIKVMVFLSKDTSAPVKVFSMDYKVTGFLNKDFSVLVKATTTVYIKGITVMSKDKVT